jgi:Protein of unknown function (DUF2630)
VDDAEIRDRIEALEGEERRLRSQESEAAEVGRADVLAADRDRLARIKVELDQLWDLLRRRNALRAAGEDPDTAALRDPRTVEGYLG